MRKDEVEFHGNPSLPAVNVKVYGTLEEGYRAFLKAEGDEIDPRFTFDWIEEHVDLEGEYPFWTVCEWQWEQIETDAETIFWKGVRVWAEGRSGGWAVVEGLPPVESWDAVFLGQWARFCKLARSLADDVPYLMADCLYYNDFAAWAESIEDQRSYAFGAFADDRLDCTEGVEG